MLLSTVAELKRQQMAPCVEVEGVGVLRLFEPLRKESTKDERKENKLDQTTVRISWLK